MSSGASSTQRFPSLATMVMISLVLGAVSGLFFGEYCAWLKWVGDAYVGLLQMAVLPFVIISLVANVGRLSLVSGRRLAVAGTLVLLVLWGTGLAVMLMMSLSFPRWETGSFYSTSFVEQPPDPDWLALFIPANPFHAMANNMVPAVVLFSIGIGLALMGIARKQELLGPLDVLIEALSRLNKLVISLAPVGLFAIVASTTGTIRVEQFALMHGYLLAYAAATLLIVFGFLPALIACCTPLRYRDVVGQSRGVLIAAFVIGNSFVLLPMIIESVNRMFKKYDLHPEASHAKAEFVIPLAYPFPDVGRIVGLLFLPFAAWFYGTSIEPSHYPALIGVGILGSFAKLVVTIPLLLNLAQVPSDIFNLFLSMGVVASRFGDLMKTMHLITFAILTSCLLMGRFRISWSRLPIALGASAVVAVILVLAVRGYLDLSFKHSYDRNSLIASRTLLLEPTATSEQPPPYIALQPGQSRLDRIREQGVIRIGFDPDELPFSYFNEAGELVGLDVELAHRLARDLGVSIQFVPYLPSAMDAQLREDQFDLALGGLEGTVRRAEDLQLAGPYLDVHLAFVVPDHDTARFRSLSQLAQRDDLRLGVMANSFFAERITHALPLAEVVYFETESEFFDGGPHDLDALVTSAETASAWTLLRPQFNVVNPVEGESVRVPLYFLSDQDPVWNRFLQHWLEMTASVGVVERLYEYWVLGEEEADQQPRWSILRNVLHWVE